MIQPSNATIVLCSVAYFYQHECIMNIMYGGFVSEGHLEGIVIYKIWMHVLAALLSSLGG